MTGDGARASFSGNEAFVDADHALHVKHFFGLAAAGQREGFALRGGEMEITQHGICQRLCLTWGHEIAVFTVVDGFAASGDVGGDDGLACGAGFHEGAVHALAVGGKYDDRARAAIDGIHVAREADVFEDAFRFVGFHAFHRYVFRIRRVEGT